MSATRTQYSPETKAKVALEAIVKERSVSEIASHYGIHASQVNQWKTQAIQSMIDGFKRSRRSKKSEEPTKQASVLSDVFELVDKFSSGSELTEETEETEE